MADLPQNPISKPVRILVINPNSNKSMTAGIDKLIAGLAYPSESTQISTYTASSGPTSIDTLDDADVSARTVYAAFLASPSFFQYDAYIVACYSPHPLLGILRSDPTIQDKPVIGIFEASISLALNLLPVNIPNGYANLPSIDDPQGPGRGFTAKKFGIVTTGAAWVPVLTEGVNVYLGETSSSETSLSMKFRGVESTGLSAEELHSTPVEEVKERMIAATRRLVKHGDVGVIVLGCAGMAGMGEWVREACAEELGTKAAGRMRIVDGVKAAITLADGQARDR